MKLVILGNWLTSTALSQWIQRTHGVIAGIQIVHILCLATLFALVLNLSLRVAGRGLAMESLASLAARFVPAIWLCLAVLLLSGSLLIIAEPHRTLGNRFFYTKMALLLVAIVMTVRLASVARRQPDQRTRVRVVVVSLYMLLWTGIIVAGRLIAYN